MLCNYIFTKTQNSGIATAKAALEALSCKLPGGCNGFWKIENMLKNPTGGIND
jgi:hypothetical protein